jgi:hypothetical protein
MMQQTSRLGILSALAFAAVCWKAPALCAQTAETLAIGDVGEIIPPHPQTRVEVAQRLSRVVNVSWNDASLAEVFAQIEEVSGLTIMPMWLVAAGDETDEKIPTTPLAKVGPSSASTRTQAVPRVAKQNLSATPDDNTTTPAEVTLPPIEQRVGLRRDVRITLRASQITLQHALELVLLKADAQATTATIGSTWQCGPVNVLQVGPRERLDRFVRLDTYDVANVLQVIEDWRYEGPAFVRGAPSSGFGANSGFEDTRLPLERGEALRQIIMDTCEPEAWIERGGMSATIRFELGSKSMVVRAPDYVHRDLDGYRWDPASDAEIGEPMPVALPPAKRPARTQPAGS